MTSIVDEEYHPHLTRPMHCCYHGYRQALVTMCSAYHSKALAYPVPDLCRLLALDQPTQTTELCRQLGLTIGDKGVCFTKGAIKAECKVGG